MTAATAGAFVSNGFFTSGHEASSPTRKSWVADPPPFGTSTKRFGSPEARTSSTPQYHCAYRDIMQGPRWNAKGWVGIDDGTKPGRGTTVSVLGTSSLVRPATPPRHGASLAPLTASHPNETRLQELLALQRRKVTPAPGPGQYQTTGWKPSRKTFRRPHEAGADGPFFLDQMPGGESTRAKEISALIKASGDSGLAPGQYEAASVKDVLSRKAPQPRVGTADRTGRTLQAKSLSVSRSIQYGIDWHVPVVIQPRPATAQPALQHLQSSTSNTTNAAQTKPGTAPASYQHNSAAASCAGTAGGIGSSGAAGGSIDHFPPPPPPGTAPHSQSAYTYSAGSVGFGGFGAAIAGGSGAGFSPLGSREASPSNGRTAAADAVAALGSPPPPPRSVARGVRREAKKRPGSWDWNRLGFNHRGGWSMAHGGAYSHGEKPPLALMRQQQQQQQQGGGGGGGHGSPYGYKGYTDGGVGMHGTDGGGSRERFDPEYQRYLEEQAGYGYGNGKNDNGGDNGGNYDGDDNAGMAASTAAIFTIPEEGSETLMQQQSMQQQQQQGVYHDAQRPWEQLQPQLLPQQHHPSEQQPFHYAQPQPHPHQHKHQHQQQYTSSQQQQYDPQYNLLAQQHYNHPPSSAPAATSHDAFSRGNAGDGGGDGGGLPQPPLPLSAGNEGQNGLGPAYGSGGLGAQHAHNGAHNGGGSRSLLDVGLVRPEDLQRRRLAESWCAAVATSSIRKRDWNARQLE